MEPSGRNRKAGHSIQRSRIRLEVGRYRSRAWNPKAETLNLEARYQRVKSGRCVGVVGLSKKKSEKVYPKGFGTEDPARIRFPQCKHSTPPAQHEDTYTPRIEDTDTDVRVMADETVSSDGGI